MTTVLTAGLPSFIVANEAYVAEGPIIAMFSFNRDCKKFFQLDIKNEKKMFYFIFNVIF
jgi:hypothetical protein